MGGHCDDNNAANPRSGIDSETPIPWENRARDQAAGGSSTRHTQELAEFYSSGGQRRDTHGISRHQYPLLCCSAAVPAAADTRALQAGLRDVRIQHQHRPQAGRTQDAGHVTRDTCPTGQKQSMSAISDTLVS